jgi:phosphoribosylanthranilate isomerase
VCPVGVFWDHPPAHVAAIVAECGLGAVQLHGLEPPEVVAAAPVPVLKSIKIRDAQDLAQLDRYKPAAFLLDSPARWSEGEARVPISWTLAREATARGRIILAAGLTPETVGEAVRVARPWGVDVNSGVEATPGRKDLAKIERFIRAARAAAAGLEDAGGGRG